MSFIPDSLTFHLVGKVGDAVIKEVKFLCAVKEEVEEMQIELQWMQSFLEDAYLQAQSQQPHSRVFRQWVSQIKEASLDAEDVVNSYLVKLALRKRGGIFNLIKRLACIVKETRDIHEVGSEIEAVKSRLASLRTRLQTYGIIRDLRLGESFATSFGDQTELWKRRTYGHIVDPNVVGLDGKTEEVVGLLLKKKEPCRVVSIYGMGGLGKTTLAKKVYYNDEIRRSFDKFVWMFVSHQFKPRDVLETIYIELKSPLPEERKEIERLKDDELASKLYEAQKDQKCFIVLDDIWSIVAWSKLSAAFPMEELATGSKLLLTTRNRELSEHVDRRGSYSGLKHLSPDQSWELLQKIAFAGRDNIKDMKSMEKLGREMITHCGGLPLAIVVLAGTLATKETLREWQIVHDNIRAYLRRGKGGNEEERLGVDGVLSSSYYDLPRELKSCFLYLSQFPEDHEIQTSRLLKMWIAEGFVCIQNDGDGEEMVEDMAERYLHQLVGRGMIQVGKEGSTGRIKTCRMHDLMRDVCLAKSKEENFIQSCSRGIERNTNVGSVRRLSLFSDEDSTMFYYQRNYQLRSLIVYGNFKRSRNFENLSSPRMMTNCKLLRMLVLELIDIKGKRFLKEIGNLVQLKYLSLRNSLVSYCPSLKKLGCLETLDLRVFKFTGRGPFGCGLNANEIWMMKNLRHLYLPDGCSREYSRWSKKLQIDMKCCEYVQTLVHFPPLNCPVSEVVKFPNVRKLGIVGSKDQLVEFSELWGHKKVEFSRLSSLSLISADPRRYFPEKIDLEGILKGCPNVYKLRIHGRLVNIPAEVNQLATKLTKLVLKESQIEDPKHIETNIGKLPNLNILHLRWQSFNGTKLCFQPGTFPQLKSLILSGLNNLWEWRVDQGAMPFLQSLSIDWCEKLKMVPEGLRFIDTLKELRIYGIIKERVKEGGADYDKVKHIPTIIT